MTTIELRFFESAVRFFSEQSNQKVDWEERRFHAASIILAGMMANYDNSTPASFLVEDAVRLADSLIGILSDPNRTPKCTEHYQR